MSLTREQIEEIRGRGLLNWSRENDIAPHEVLGALCDLALAALSGVPQGYVLVPVEKLQRYEVLFETAGLYGMEEKYRDGSQTPNARAHLECAAEIKAMLQEQPVHTSAVPNTSPTDFQWIAVSERLPSGRVQVLFVNLFSGKPIVCLGFKENDDPDSRQWFDMSSTDVDGDYRDCYEVTHWMPLPPPPQARRDEADAQTNEED